MDSSALSPLTKKNPESHVADPSSRVSQDSEGLMTECLGDSCWYDFLAL